MTNLADTHVHLLAGLDDGPEDDDEAEAMCRMLVNEGVRHATALAHQNESWPDNTADRLRQAAAKLAKSLENKKIPLAVYPTAEVMLPTDPLNPNYAADFVADWKAGNFLSVGDHKQWLLVEMPHNFFVNVLPIAAKLEPLGVRLIIAHAERYPDLLHNPKLTAGWAAAGCLIQVTAHSLASSDDTTKSGLREWAKRGLIHVLGSDGHGIDRRLPEMAEGFKELKSILPKEHKHLADVIGFHRGVAVLQGLPVNIPPPNPPSKSWFTRLMGG